MLSIALLDTLFLKNGERPTEQIETHKVTIKKHRSRNTAADTPRAAIQTVHLLKGRNFHNDSIFTESSSRTISILLFWIFPQMVVLVTYVQISLGLIAGMECDARTGPSTLSHDFNASYVIGA